MPAVNTGIYFSWTIRDQSRMHQGRLRLRPWLEEQIESGQYPGVMWLDKTGRVFQIPWKHAARHGWNIDKDATLFRNWAMHTGKYKPGIDKPDPKTWKANFRCALNSLPDVKELQDKSMKKGSNAFRVYTLLPTTKTPKRRKGFKALNSDVRTGLPSLPPSTNTPLERFAEAFCRYREGDAGYSPDIFHKRDSFSSFNSMKQERPEDHFCPQSSLTPEAHGSREDTTDDHEQTEAVLKQIVDHLKNMEHWNPSLEHDRGWRPATSTWMDCFCEAMDYSGYPLQTTCHIHSVPPSEFS